MGSSTPGAAGPNLRTGVPLDAFGESGVVAGEVDGEPVLLVRRGEEVLAVDGACTHYGGPLAEGLVVGDEVRCPWHHACFSLRTGDVLAAPALRPLGRWATRTEDGRVRVLGRAAEAPPTSAAAPGSQLSRVIIVGAGAAGASATVTLRNEGYGGEILLIDPDPEAPYDRPSLSKEFLAGTASEDWLPLWPPQFHVLNRIRRITARVESLDAGAKRIRLSNGTELTCDALLIATGSAPVIPRIPGSDLPHVRVLRSLADCRALVRSAPGASVVIAGASFIGLEAAAALRARGLSVTVVAPEAVPFGTILGEDVGLALRSLHEQHGVEFRLGRSLAAIEPTRVQLDDGSTEAADVVLLGVGVRPAAQFADALRPAGGGVGIAVDDRLQTRAAGVFAAGDIALYPDPSTGEGMRIEHWVVAQRQGAAAARNILGHDEPFREVPFFWTQQYDFTLSYVGHGAGWDEVALDGDLATRDCRITYLRAGRPAAVATVGRDRESLRAELALQAEVTRPHPPRRR